MIYIENNRLDPRYNLAFEEYVFMNVKSDEPILLLWQNEPSVIIGKFQNALEEINSDFVGENNIHVVRRNTGGGAVYHDLGNLNYSFIIPGVASKVDFKTFTIPVVKALQSVGIDAHQTGRNDILIGDKKFSGNAQQFSKHRLLHHGTLMFDVNMENVAKSLSVKPGKFASKSTKSVKSRVINLKPLMKIDTVDEFKKLLLTWFDREYGIEKIDLTQGELEEIERLKSEKYSSKEWNYGRSPKADIVRGDFFGCGFIEFHFEIEKHFIKDVTIVGDFFSTAEISELEDKIKGIEYEKQALWNVFEEVDLEKYFGDVSAEELINVIV